MRVETVSASAREKVGAPNQRAMKDILVESRVVGGGAEGWPERPRRRVVASVVVPVVLAMVVRVGAVVVDLPVRHGLLV